MGIIKLTEDVSVSTQIDVGDLKEISELGYRTIINNRPDYESLVQCTDQEVQEEAERHNLHYVFIPVGHQGFRFQEIAYYSEIYTNLEKPILAYCRTGTRSTMLWSLMQAHSNIDNYTAEEIYNIAKNAGYELSPIMPAIEQLANQEK